MVLGLIPAGLVATPQVPQLTHPLGALAVGVVDPVLPARAEQAVPGAFTAAVAAVVEPQSTAVTQAQAVTALTE